MAGIIVAFWKPDTNDILIFPYPPRCKAPTLKQVTNEALNPVMNMACDTKGVDIIYTVNGTDPTHEEGVPFDPRAIRPRHVLLYGTCAKRPDVTVSKPEIDLAYDQVDEPSVARSPELHALNTRFSRLLLPRYSTSQARGGRGVEIEETSFDDTAQINMSAIRRVITSPEYRDMLDEAYDAGFQLSAGMQPTPEALVAALDLELDPSSSERTTRRQVLQTCLPSKFIRTLSQTGGTVAKTIRAVAVCRSGARLHSEVVEMNLSARRTEGPIAFRRSETRGVRAYLEAISIRDARAAGQSPPAPSDPTVKALLNIVTEFPMEDEVTSRTGAILKQPLRNMTINALERRLIIESKIVAGADTMKSASLGKHSNLAKLQSERDESLNMLRAIACEFKRSSIASEIDIVSTTKDAVCWYTEDTSEPNFTWKQTEDETKMVPEPQGTTSMFGSQSSVIGKPIMKDPRPSETAKDCTLLLRMIATCDGAMQSSTTMARFTPQTVSPVRLYRSPMPSTKIIIECDTKDAVIYFSVQHGGSWSADNVFVLEELCLDEWFDEGAAFESEKMRYTLSMHPSFELSTTAPFVVNAQARLPGWCASPLKSAVFQSERVSQPLIDFSPASGQVSFRCETRGVTIRFSMNQFDRIEEGTIYDGSNGPKVDLLQARTERVRCMVSFRSATSLSASRPPLCQQVAAFMSASRSFYV